MKLRYHTEYKTEGVLVLESPPQTRTVFAYCQSGYTKRVSFPYLLHVVTYQKVGGRLVYPGIYGKGLLVFVNTKPLVTIEDAVCVCPTERDRFGLVCTPHQYDHKPHPSIHALATSVVTLWWNTYHVLTAEHEKILLADVCNVSWGKTQSLRGRIDQDYLQIAGYGPTVNLLPKDAPLVDEDFTPETLLKVWNS